MIGSALEAAVGMEAYATPGERCGGRAKSSPEDFRVEELISTAGMLKDRTPGYYPVYRVQKRGIDTMHMAKEMSAELKSRVSYGGLKDSKAAASQYLTPTSLRSSNPERIVRGRFSAELVGWLPKPLTRGSVAGNRFEIVLRDCCAEVGQRIEEAFGAARAGRVPNYFGLQRFGSRGAGTHLVGKAMVRGDFEGAVNLILGRVPGGGDLVRKGGGEVALTPGQDVERLVGMAVAKYPGEWTRALRAVPIRLRRLYVQAYQSYIFNRSLSSALLAGEDISAYMKGDNWAEVSGDGLAVSYVKSASSTPEGRATPMVQVAGYAFRDYGSRFDRHVKEVMEAEQVSPPQFFIEEMQEASAEGGFRQAHMAVADEAWKVEGSDAELRFTLARGQYATVLLREVLKPEDPQVSGLA